MRGFALQINLHHTVDCCTLLYTHSNIWKVQLQPYNSAQTTITNCCAWSHPQEVLKGCPVGLIRWLVSYKAQNILCYHYQLNKNTDLLRTPTLS
jgi:hypothetical protein